MDDTNNTMRCTDSPRLRAWRRCILVFTVLIVAFQYYVDSVIAPVAVRITGVMWQLPEQEDEATLARFFYEQLGIGVGLLEMFVFVFALRCLVRSLVASSWRDIIESALLAGLCVAGVVLAFNTLVQFMD